jgi:spermidine/putrescine transport system substrate-binding protein
MKRLMTATALLMATVAGHCAGEGVLNLFNWGNYTSPELLEKFKAETGITVTVTDYDSNDTALAKVEAGGTGSTWWCPRPTMCRSGWRRG